MSGVQVVSAATDVLRDGHYELDATSGLYVRTLLLEGARTNACLRSQEFDHATWAKVGTTVSANTAIAPDGTLTADLLAEDGSTGAHYTSCALTGLTSSAEHSVAVFLKAGVRSLIQVYLVNGAQLGVEVDLAAGTISSVTHSGATLSRSRLVRETNGWYRVEFAGILGAVTTATLGLVLANSPGSLSYAGIVGAGVYLWGAQVEIDQPCPSSYIATTSSAVTRSADVCYVAFPYTPQAFTAYFRFVECGTSVIAGARIFSISDASLNTPCIDVSSAGAGGQMTAFHYNGASNVSATVGPPIAIGDEVEVRVVLGADGSILIGASVNGATEIVSSTSAALAFAAAWSGQRLYLNAAGALNPGLMALRAAKIARNAHSLTDMRSL